MALYDLFDTNTGALLREAVAQVAVPVDPVGKGWAWQLHVKPQRTTTHDVQWDPEVHQFALVPVGPATVAARLDTLAAELVAEVKREAYAAIVEYLPEWKQRNLTARGVQLLRRIQAATATPEEIAEADAIEAAWGNVEAIRDASDVAEAAIAAARAANDEAAMRAAAVVAWPAPG